MISIERILSPTAINTYMSCPRKFYLRYIEKLTTKPSIHLIRGNIVHKTIHEFYKNQIRGPPPNYARDVHRSLLRIFNRQWLEQENAFDALSLPRDEIQYYHGDSQLMLLNFGDWFIRQEPPSFVDASEVKLFSDNLRLMGIIDAIQFKGGDVNLIDYKTSKNAVITDDIMRQATIYALLYQDRHKKAPRAVCIHFLKEPGEPIPIHIDEHILEYGKILVESIRAKTRSTDEQSYPCTCGGQCESEFINGR